MTEVNVLGLAFAILFSIDIYAELLFGFFGPMRRTVACIYAFFNLGNTNYVFQLWSNYPQLHGKYYVPPGRDESRGTWRSKLELLMLSKSSINSHLKVALNQLESMYMYNSKLQSEYDKVPTSKYRRI